MSEDLERELAAFKDIWQGGYCEGDPLNPLARSGYGQFGYVSVLYAIYLRCIRPYVGPETVALEIGPGRGAWTRALVGAKEVWAMDALSAEHNAFYEFVGRRPNIRYVHVKDFSCSELPEEYFTYMFSFGCLCHVSFDGIRAYARNLFGRLRSGCVCFWMVADYAKYNATVSRPEMNSVFGALAASLPPGKQSALLRRVLMHIMRRERRLTHNQHPVAPDTDMEPRPGRWYDAGIDRTVELLTEAGYVVQDRDVGASLRDPIIQFTKP